MSASQSNWIECERQKGFSYSTSSLRHLNVHVNSYMYGGVCVCVCGVCTHGMYVCICLLNDIRWWLLFFLHQMLLLSLVVWGFVRACVKSGCFFFANFWIWKIRRRILLLEMIVLILFFFHTFPILTMEWNACSVFSYDRIRRAYLRHLITTTVNTIRSFGLHTVTVCMTACVPIWILVNLWNWPHRPNFIFYGISYSACMVLRKVAFYGVVHKSLFQRSGYPECNLPERHHLRRIMGSSRVFTIFPRSFKLFILLIRMNRAK